MKKIISFLIILNFSCENSKFNSFKDSAKKIDFVFVDLDGTLLKNNNISTENEKAIKRSIEKGARVIIATGRPFTGTDPFDQSEKYYVQLGLNTPIVCMNGAFIYDPTKNEVFKQVEIPLSIARGLSNIINKKNNQFTTQQSKLLRLKYYHYKTKNSISLTTAYNLEEENGPVYKILILVRDKSQSNQIYELLQQEFGNSLNIYRTLSNNLEITDISVSKGEAIKYIKNHLDGYSTIGRETAIAIGDGTNDISMKKEVKFIAMQNAEDGVKKTSDGITFGVAEALRKYVLGNK